MSFVNEFFRTILPKQNEGKIRVMLCNGMRPDIMIFSDDEGILKSLAMQIQRKATEASNEENLRLDQIGKPNVFRQVNHLFDTLGIDAIGNNKYQFTFNQTQLSAICKNLKIAPAEMIHSELREKGAVLGEGHRTDNTDKLEIDYSFAIHQPSLEEFKKAYNEKSKSKVTRNPFSFMLRHINDIKSIDEVEKHAKTKPTSLTAEVLRELKFDQLEKYTNENTIMLNM